MWDAVLFDLITTTTQGCVHLVQNATTIMQPCNNLKVAATYVQPAWGTKHLEDD